MLGPAVVEDLVQVVAVGDPEVLVDERCEQAQLVVVVLLAQPDPDGRRLGHGALLLGVEVVLDELGQAGEAGELGRVLVDCVLQALHLGAQR